MSHGSGPPDSTHSRPPSGRYRPTPGQQLGPYRLISLLGKGGMGEVYLARDTSLGRDVALKFLNRVDPTRLERFQREAEVTAKLVHAGIVRLHGTSSAEGRPYLVYELVEGAQPLDHAFRTRDLRARVELLRDVARALGYAHAQGVVHRDIKPDNVLVDDQGQARISDFGLALDDSVDRLTQTGALVGTPYYMAPEQIAGARAQVGPPSDVWALGVILYQACCDTLPFTGDGLLALSAAIVDHTPPPLTGGAAGLQPVVARALAKDAHDRYPDASALAKDLDTWLAGGRLAASRGVRLALAVGLATAAAVLALAWRSGTPAAPSVTPSVTPSAAPARPTSPPPRVAIDVERVFQGDPAQRIVAAHDLLLAAPDHPQADAIRAALRELASSHPLARITLATRFKLLGAWVGDELVIASPEGLQRFSPTGVPGLLLELDLRGERALTRLGDRLIVFSGASQQLLAVDLALTRAVPWAPLTSEGVELIASPRGDRLAVRGAIDKDVWLFDAEGRELRALQAPDNHSFWGLAWSPDGEHLFLADRSSGGGGDDLLAGSEANELVLLRAADGVELSRQSSPSITRVASYASDGSLVLGTRIGQLLLFPPRAEGLPWRGEPELLMGESLDDPGGRDPMAFVSAHPGGVGPLVWDPAGRLHSASEGTEPGQGPPLLRCWDGDGKHRSVRPLTAPAARLSVSANGRYLAVSLRGGPVEVYLIAIPGD